MLDSQKNSNRYDKYKDSGIKWIGTIPDSWCIRKLNSLLNAIGSGTTPKGNDNYYDGDIYWLNTGDLNDSYISTINKTVTEIALQECSTLKIFPKDSVVIAMYGATIGKLGMLMFPATTNQACCVMSCSSQLNNKYLFYLLFSARDFILNLSYGAGQPNISQETIKSFRLSLPTIIEQETIADYLDKKCGGIDEVIDKQKAVIEKLKEYKQSIITEAVTKGLDKSVPLKDSGIEWIGQIPQHWEICKLLKLFKDRKCPNKGNVENNVLSLSYGNIKRRNIETNLGLLPESFESYNIIEPNNIVLRLTDLQNDHKSLRCGLVKEKGIITSAYTTLELKDPMQSANYFYRLLHTFDIEKGFYGMGAGVRQSLKFEGELCNLYIIKPPVMEQQQIADFLDQKCSEIDITISEKELLIEKLTEYKKSLIYECVTGKRRVVA